MANARENRASGADERLIPGTVECRFLIRDCEVRISQWSKSVLLFLLLAVIPLGILIHAHSQDGGVLSLIHFGLRFASSQLPQLRSINPPLAVNPDGYDGQFYAQIALDPLLRSGHLEHALDNPAFRARRIGLPALAALLGGGNVELTLYVFALINFAFWVLLAVLLLRFRPPATWRDVAMIVAMLWTSGTLISLSLALTDLPAAVLGVTALLARGGRPVVAWLLGLSALFRETSVLSFGAALASGGDGLKPILNRASKVIPILTLPLVAWMVYVQLNLPSAAGLGSSAGLGHGIFALPLTGLAGKILNAAHTLYWGTGDVPLVKRFYFLFELLAPLSLTVQAVYLFLRPRLTDPIWAFGAGFAVLLVFLGDSVWIDQFGYCRILLPLTFAFNLLIHATERSERFWWWFVVGNLGLTSILGRTLLTVYTWISS